MARERVLVVEDDLGVLQMMVGTVQNAPEHYLTYEATTRADALKQVRKVLPDLVLLDLHLDQHLEGLDICRAIRAHPRTADTAVVMLTGELSEEAEAGLLDAGADDYIRKAKFNPKMLLARMRAILRRRNPHRTETITYGPLVLDPVKQETQLKGKALALSETEFDILYTFAKNQDRAVSRHELLHGRDIDVRKERVVDVHVSSIRKKLGEYAWLVQTVVGIGYCMGTESEE